MNVYDEHGFRVILDYGHNEAAVGAMVDLVERLQPAGQAHRLRHLLPATAATRTCAPSPRRSRASSTSTSCHSDDDTRGRDATEIPEMMRDALIEFGVDEDAVQIVLEEEAAVDTALTLARPNDLVLIFCDGITRSWKRIIYFNPVEKPTPVPPERLRRRLRLRRARRLSVSSATSAASASSPLIDRKPRMAPWSLLAARAAAGGNRLAVIGGRLEDDNVAIYRRDAPPVRRAHPGVSHRLG